MQHGFDGEKYNFVLFCAFLFLQLFLGLSRFTALCFVLSYSSEARARAWNWKPRTSFVFFSSSEESLSYHLSCTVIARHKTLTCMLQLSSISLLSSFCLWHVRQYLTPHMQPAMKFYPAMMHDRYISFSSAQRLKPCIIWEEAQRKHNQLTLDANTLMPNKCFMSVGSEKLSCYVYESLMCFVYSVSVLFLRYIVPFSYSLYFCLSIRLQYFL